VQFVCLVSYIIVLSSTNLSDRLTFICCKVYYILVALFVTEKNVLHRRTEASKLAPIATASFLWNGVE